jgi:agmatine/peptidylarginine deiminase
MSGPGDGGCEAQPPALATPRADGFAMPPEWAERQLTLMAWPCTPSTYWRGGAGAFERVQREQAGVANAIADFEPVLMLVRPEQAAAARAALSARVELLPIALDEAWIRDSGPVFVRDDAGRVALVQFGFNAWGGEAPSEHDARVPQALAAHLGVLDTGATRGIPYLNAYLCNSAVIAPVGGVEEDALELELLRAEHAGRTVVPVPARAIFAGGGGPHCVTQQVPAGAFAVGRVGRRRRRVRYGFEQIDRSTRTEDGDEEP